VVATVAVLMPPINQRHLGLAVVAIAVVSWSSAGLFTRILSVDVPNILFWRGIFGALGLFAVVAWLPATGGLHGFRKLGSAGFAYAIITAVSMLFFVSALRHTSVAHVAIITAIVPFTAAYLGWLALKEVPTLAALIASGVALFGVILMVGLHQDGHWFGDSLAIIMAVCMATMILISRKHPHIPALQATCLASLLSALLVIPAISFAPLNVFEFGTLVAFSIVNQVIGFGLFALGARWLPPTQTALLTALEAPLAPLWVWIVLSEKPGSATIVGGILVMIAVIGHVLWEGRHMASASGPTSSA
jgi:drug/metabolite transporter (DMT)-like permease